MSTTVHDLSSQADGQGVLIVGACQAGVQLASSLRENGWTQPITLVGAERHLPYQRPPLSKQALHDGIVPADLALRSQQFFDDHDITLLLDDRVTSLDVSRTGQGSATTRSGRQMSFARLALTVGARPRRLDLPGAELDGIFYLRDSEDASSLRLALTSTPRVVVIGGGLIGLEAAATARRLGSEVTVVLADDRLMARAVSPRVSDFFRAAHESRGVEVRPATLPVAYLDDRHGRVGGVQLADGEVLPADVVIVGVGAAPRTELAEDAGLAVAGGIVVDQHGLTSDGVTVAAGDCTVWNGGRYESVNAATEQAKAAAATIVGEPRPWTSAPWFWSDQFDLKLQVAGIVPTDGSSVLRHDGTGMTVLHYTADRLVAVESINRPADFMAARSAITKGRTIDPGLAGDVNVLLKTLAVDPDQHAREVMA